MKYHFYNDTPIMNSILSMQFPSKVKELIEGLECAVKTANDPEQREISLKLKAMATYRYETLKTKTHN